MQLTVSGLSHAPLKFDHLFGKYVKGFRPWKHCAQCFISNNVTAIRPDMQDGVFDLEDRLFYLCGVGKKLSDRIHPELARRRTNVHLAVRPRMGSVAAIGSVYGAVFTITDAEQIPIERLPKGFMDLPDTHTQCRNFQFCWQTFAASGHDIAAEQEVSTLRVT